MPKYNPLTLRYRPQKFSDLVGQEHVTTILQNMLKSGRIFPGILMSGSRGSGKTTSARILAKALNCENPLPDKNPCCECTNCKEIIAESSFLVEEFDAASHGNVDNVRGIKEAANYVSVGGKYKVWIIDEAHSLTRQAFEAFLKLLEEPPDHVIFIFCSTDIHKFPETILSRCMIFNFKRQKVDSIVDRLVYICNQEKLNYEPEALQLIAQSSDGGMRDSISLLDQVVSFSTEGDVKAEYVKKILGLVPESLYFAFIQALSVQDIKSALGVLDQIYASISDIEVFVDGLMRIYRDLVFTLNNVSPRDASPHYLQELSKFSSNIDLPYVMHCIEVLLRMRSYLHRGNLAGRFILDSGVIHLIPSTRKISNEAKRSEVREAKFSDFDSLLGALSAEEVVLA